MSISHVYYLGIKNKKTNMVRFAGPYDKDGKILSIYQQGSYSPLSKTLSELPEEEMSDDLKKEFTYEDWNGKDRLDTVRIGELDYDVSIPLLNRYIYVDALNDDTVSEYYDSDVMDDCSMSEREYAIFCKACEKNPNKIRKIYLESIDDYIETKPNDYILYRWIDYDSPELAKYMIYESASNLGLAYHYAQDEEIVILEVCG